jgi:hypothetical protein
MMHHIRIDINQKNFSIKALLFILCLILAVSCTNDKGIMCTEEFRMLTITIRDSASKPVLLSKYNERNSRILFNGYALAIIQLVNCCRLIVICACLCDPCDEGRVFVRNDAGKPLNRIDRFS